MVLKKYKVFIVRDINKVERSAFTKGEDGYVILGDTFIRATSPRDAMKKAQGTIKVIIDKE